MTLYIVISYVGDEIKRLGDIQSRNKLSTKKENYSLKTCVVDRTVIYRVYTPLGVSSSRLS